MPCFTSSAFSYVLMNKGEDGKESIAAATQRMLESRQLISVKRKKRFFYIQPAELTESDVIQNQSQKESSEIQNNTEVNPSNKLSVDNNTNNQQVNSRPELSLIKQANKM